MLIHIILLIIFIINALGIFAFIKQKQKTNITSNLNTTSQGQKISTGMFIVYIILLILCSFGLYLFAQNMD